jgi:hypothetical protein
MTLFERVPALLLVEQRLLVRVLELAVRLADQPEFFPVEVDPGDEPTVVGVDLALELGTGSPTSMMRARTTLSSGDSAAPCACATTRCAPLVPGQRGIDARTARSPAREVPVRSAASAVTRPATKPRARAMSIAVRAGVVTGIS